MCGILALNLRVEGSTKFMSTKFASALYMYDVCQETLYYIFVLRSYRHFARVPQGSRKVPAREAASDPNEHLVTEYSQAEGAETDTPPGHTCEVTPPALGVPRGAGAWSAAEISLRLSHGGEVKQG